LNKFENHIEKKLSERNELRMSSITKGLLRELNSQNFLNFLEELTGIRGLIPDPSMLEENFIEQIGGGFLKIIPISIIAQDSV